MPDTSEIGCWKPTWSTCVSVKPFDPLKWGLCALCHGIKFNGSHFDLPPRLIHRMTGLGGKVVWTMTYSHRPHFWELQCSNYSTLSTMTPSAVHGSRQWCSMKATTFAPCAGTQHLVVARPQVTAMIVPSKWTPKSTTKLTETSTKSKEYFAALQVPTEISPEDRRSSERTWPERQRKRRLLHTWTGPKLGDRTGEPDHQQKTWRRSFRNGVWGRRDWSGGKHRECVCCCKNSERQCRSVRTSKSWVKLDAYSVQ